MGFIFSFLSLIFVVIIHELGHFFAAKATKTGVLEFSIGMGPLIYKKKKKETVYSLRALPVGGFVKLAGMDSNENENVPEKENYNKKTKKQRAFILLAGSLANILLGFIIFLFLSFSLGNKTPLPIIKEVIPNSPADISNLKKGDEILKLNNKVIKNINNDFIEFIRKNNSKPIKITIKRNNEKININNIIPVKTENRYIVGIYFEVKTEKYNIKKSISLSIRKTINVINMGFKSIKMLLFGEAKLKDLAGPVGIVQIASSQLNQGITYFINIIAIISISLGVINLFPIPILDGGHLTFLLIETIRKKPLNKKVEITITNIMSVLLISLMIFIIFNDIINWQERITLLKKLN